MEAGNAEKFEPSTSLFIKNYVKILDNYLPIELRQPDRRARVISVGCGFALELTGLQQLLPDSYIEAIDKSADAVYAAQQWHPEFPQDRIRLVDATNRESFGEEDWDLIVVRNPQVEPDVGIISCSWEQILRNCFDKLKQNGFLYLTTLSQIEMQGLLGFLSQFPLKDVTPNDPGRTHLIKPPIENGFPMTEDYIAILKKRV